MHIRPMEKLEATTVASQTERWRSSAAGGEKAPLRCCGAPMESRLAQARDRWGHVVFVAVWRCAVCERVIF